MKACNCLVLRSGKGEIRDMKSGTYRTKVMSLAKRL